MFEFFILSLSTFAAILNPLGVLPLFILYTQDLNDSELKHVSKIAVVVAGTSLIIFSVVGSYLFSFFGITLPAFRFAGGVILFLIAMDMLRANQPRTKTTEEEETESLEKSNIAVFPLAVPVVCGPGAITTALILGEKSKNVYESLILILCITAIMFFTYFSFVFSKKISNLMGHVGRNVMTRFMGIILAGVATQFIFDSLSDFLKGL